MEVLSTNLDVAEAANCASLMRDADKRASDIANTIIRLRDELNELQQSQVCTRRYLKCIRAYTYVARSFLLNCVEQRKHKARRTGRMQAKTAIDEIVRTVQNGHRRGTTIGEKDKLRRK